MARNDDDLLARLNALKPSSAKFSPVIDVGTSQPQTVEDKLAARLKSLRSGNQLEPLPSARESFSPVESLTAQIRDEVAAEKDPIRDWQQQDGDEQSLEQLLAELGPDDQWKLDPEDPKNIESLMKEAKSALPPPSDPDAKANENNPALGTDVRSQTTEAEEWQDEKNKDQQDEQEADDYIKQMLADLELGKKYWNGNDEGETMSETHGPSATALDLPSTPSRVPETSSNDAPSQQDVDLEARFAKLGLDGLELPSTPTSAPSTKPKVIAKIKPNSNLPAYTDEDIESWCCICNEDASVRCLGCDGDVYCNDCWREGHGPGPEQEQGHKAIQYTKKGPAATT